jgi:predicted Zn-dependent protease
MRPRLFFFVLVLLPSGTLLGCATQTNLITGENQRAAYSWQQEVQLGQEADRSVVAQFGVYDDPQLTAYVEGVGQRVLRASAYGLETTPAEVRSTPFHFKVLDSPVVNAMALPGGYIYVTRGLLTHLDNEAQLAVVLGHEIGHVLGRHISRRQAGAQLGQIGLIGAAILGEVVAPGRGVGEGIANYAGAGMQLLFLRYSRDDEREADRAGVAYAELAGYDAASAARLFRALERIGQVEGAAVPGFMSTHPEPGDRQQTIPQLAAEYDGTAENAEDFLAQLDGVILGDDPRQGFVEADVFYHPELRLQFDIPRGWQLTNTASAVQITEPSGRAAMEFAFAQEQTAEAAARAFASQQGVTVADQRNVALGSRAVRLQGSANTEQGALGFVVYFIEYGGRVYRFYGLAPAASFRTYQDAIEGAIQSFDRLSDSRLLNRAPIRVDVVRAPRAAPFTSFLRGRPTAYGVDDVHLAILNQVEPNETIAAGTPLKLPTE